jgi:hypothetical protein
VVFGVLGLGFVAFVGLLVASVTFLGRSAEPTFTRVDTVPLDDPYDDPYDDPSEDPYEDPDDEPFDDPASAAPAAEVVAVVADQLGADSWFLVHEVQMPADEPPTVEDCAADGWLTGHLDRAIGMFDDRGGSVPAPVTITVTHYETEADAEADLERARSTEHQACEVEQRQRIGRLDEAPEVVELPEVATAPGVAIAMTDGEGRTEYDQTIVVGRMRAQLDVCDCASFDEPYLEWVAADVAAAMADQQGLPAPG